jgi:hypothetical protein
VIYGLTLQKIGHLLEFRCPECARLRAYRLPLVRESKALIRLYCEVHPECFGEWRSEAEMENKKFELAKRIGLLE